MIDDDVDNLIETTTTVTIAGDGDPILTYLLLISSARLQTHPPTLSLIGYDMTVQHLGAMMMTSRR